MQTAIESFRTQYNKQTEETFDSVTKNLEKQSNQKPTNFVESVIQENEYLKLKITGRIIGSLFRITVSTQNKRRSI